jgi:hypothetical protein
MAKTPDLTQATLRGPAARFNAGKQKYDVSSYSYPADIQSEEYGGNFVAFYINVSEDSKILNDKSVKTIGDIPTRDRGGMIANQEASDAGKVTTAAAAGGATAISALWKEGKLPDDWFKNSVKTVAGGAAIMAAASTTTRAQKRLATAIMLYIPNQLSIRYGTQWGEEETFDYQATLNGAQALGKAVTGAATLNFGQVADSGRQGTSIAAAIAFRGDNKNAAALSAATGLAANPKKEQVFKGVDFRTFSMDYQFFPRNETEAQNVLNIIKMFKLHMHPEFKDASNFLYIYPSEFDVYYYQGGKENLNIHRHTSCVLTDMTVNYTPNGQFNTFANGMPTQISITLNFRELAQLTKEKIGDGL